MRILRDRATGTPGGPFRRDHPRERDARPSAPTGGPPAGAAAPLAAGRVRHRGRVAHVDGVAAGCSRLPPLASGGGRCAGTTDLAVSPDSPQGDRDHASSAGGFPVTRRKAPTVPADPTSATPPPRSEPGAGAH